ncbi:hypothetical protein OfM2_15320 [Lactovum odontotermitis]
MPPTLWIAFGLTWQYDDAFGSRIGVYNPQDVWNLTEIPEYKKRQDESVKLIEQRLKDFGLPGYLQFLYNKYDANTSDGTYGWGFYHQDFFMGQNLNKSKALAPFINSSFGKFLRSFIYRNNPVDQTKDTSTHVYVYRLLSQLVFILMVIGVFLSVIRKEDYNFNHIWLLLTLMGGMAFLLIFEGGRSRYLIQFLPSIVLLSGIGYAGGNNAEDKTAD